MSEDTLVGVPIPKVETISLMGEDQHMYHDLATITRQGYNGYLISTNVEGTLYRSQYIWGHEFAVQRANELAQKVLTYLVAQKETRRLKRDIVDFTESYLHHQELEASDPYYYGTLKKKWEAQKKEYARRREEYEKKKLEDNDN